MWTHPRYPWELGPLATIHHSTIPNANPKKDLNTTRGGVRENHGWPCLPTAWSWSFPAPPPPLECTECRTSKANPQYYDTWLRYDLLFCMRYDDIPHTVLLVISCPLFGHHGPRLYPKTGSLGECAIHSGSVSMGSSEGECTYSPTNSKWKIPDLFYFIFFWGGGERFWRNAHFLLCPLLWLVYSCTRYLLGDSQKIAPFCRVRRLWLVYSNTRYLLGLWRCTLFDFTGIS